MTKLQYCEKMNSLSLEQVDAIFVKIKDKMYSYFDAYWFIYTCSVKEDSLKIKNYIETLKELPILAK